MPYITNRYEQAVVFQSDQIMPVEKAKEMIMQIEKDTDEWCGAVVCMPIFMFKIKQRNHMEIEGFINERTKLIPYDADAAADLMLVSDIDAIMHKHKYAPGEN